MSLRKNCSYIAFTFPNVHVQQLRAYNEMSITHAAMLMGCYT